MPIFLYVVGFLFLYSHVDLMFCNAICKCMFKYCVLEFLMMETQKITGFRIMDEKSTTDGVDRISDLPPFIIHHILSNLAAKELARTSVLSKRWKNLRASFPILDFHQNYFLNFDEKYLVGNELELGLESNEKFGGCIENFMRFIDVTVLRFCKLNFCMKRFGITVSFVDVEGLSSSLDKWIGLAVENDVKELDLSILTDQTKLYTLPQIVFSARSLTSLKLGGCKLEQTSDSIRFRYLKKLILQWVHINEHMVHKLTSECPLVEELSFDSCWGFKCFCIPKHRNLLSLSIYASLDELESVEIVVPSLRHLSIAFPEQLTRPCVINIAGCQQLRDLHFMGGIFKDLEFNHLVSKFALLENLRVDRCHFLERVKVSSTRLQNLSFRTCGNLKAIDVSTPNLLSFYYVNHPVPMPAIFSPCPGVVATDKRGIDPYCYYKIKAFLGVACPIKNLIIYVSPKRVCP